MSLAPTYRRDAISIFHGDCLHLLPSFSDASIDFVLTDPPYLVDYQGRWDGDRSVIAGDSESSWLLPAFEQIFRVLKDDRFCVSFYGWPHADLFVGCWKQVGFRPISHIAFVKNVWGLGRFMRGQHETAYLLAKGSPPIPANPISDIIAWERDMHAFHPNQKPIAALYPLLAAFAPEQGVVLDPFMGSGSTLRAAMDFGLSAIGIEIEAEYCRRAAARLAQGILFPLSRS